MIFHFLLILALCGIFARSAAPEEGSNEVKELEVVVETALNSISHQAHEGASSESHSLFRAPKLVVKKRALPSFQNGGVVFFLHIPKTGGLNNSFELREG